MFLNLLLVFIYFCCFSFAGGIKHGAYKDMRANFNWGFAIVWLVAITVQLGLLLMMYLQLSPYLGKEIL